MTLSHDQQQAVAQYLKTTAAPPKCPVCSASNMRIRKEVIRLPHHGAPNQHRPAIEVECQYCGHLLHFSPRVVGLSLTDPEAAESEATTD